jgi:hypothetical protein
MAFGIDDAIAAGLKIVDKFVPDPAAKAKAEAELRADLLASDRAQMAVNEKEAQSSSLFVAGWRPMIGWVCALALAYQYLLVPILLWIGLVAGKPVAKPPVLDDTLWQLMFCMLGMGGLRTFEKMKRVAR